MQHAAWQLASTFGTNCAYSNRIFMVDFFEKVIYGKICKKNTNSKKHLHNDTTYMQKQHIRGATVWVDSPHATSDSAEYVNLHLPTHMH